MDTEDPLDPHFFDDIFNYPPDNINGFSDDGLREQVDEALESLLNNSNQIKAVTDQMQKTNTEEGFTPELESEIIPGPMAGQVASLIDRLIKQNREFKDRIKNQESQLMEYERKLADSMQDCFDQQKEISGLKEQVQTLNAEKANLQQEVDIKKADLRQFKDFIDKQLKDISELDNLEKKFNSEKRKCKKLETELTKVNESLSKIKMRERQCIKENRKLMDMLQDLERKNLLTPRKSKKLQSVEEIYNRHKDREDESMSEDENIDENIAENEDSDDLDNTTNTDPLNIEKKNSSNLNGETPSSYNNETCSRETASTVSPPMRLNSTLNSCSFINNEQDEMNPNEIFSFDTPPVKVKTSPKSCPETSRASVKFSTSSPAVFQNSGIFQPEISSVVKIESASCYEELPCRQILYDKVSNVSPDSNFVNVGSESEDISLENFEEVHKEMKENVLTSKKFSPLSPLPPYPKSRSRIVKKDIKNIASENTDELIHSEREKCTPEQNGMKISKLLTEYSGKKNVLLHISKEFGPHTEKDSENIISENNQETLKPNNISSTTIPADFHYISSSYSKEDGDFQILHQGNSAYDFIVNPESKRSVCVLHVSKRESSVNKMSTNSNSADVSNLHAEKERMHSAVSLYYATENRVTSIQRDISQNNSDNSLKENLSHICIVIDGKKEFLGPTSKFDNSCFSKDTSCVTTENPFKEVTKIDKDTGKIIGKQNDGNESDVSSSCDVSPMKSKSPSKFSPIKSRSPSKFSPIKSKSPSKFFKHPGHDVSKPIKNNNTIENKLSVISPNKDCAILSTVNDEVVNDLELKEVNKPIENNTIENKLSVISPIKDSAVLSNVNKNDEVVNDLEFKKVNKPIENKLSAISPNKDSAVLSKVNENDEVVNDSEFKEVNKPIENNTIENKLSVISPIKDSAVLSKVNKNDEVVNDSGFKEDILVTPEKDNSVIQVAENLPEACNVLTVADKSDSTFSSNIEQTDQNLSPKSNEVPKNELLEDSISSVCNVKDYLENKVPVIGCDETVNPQTQVLNEKLNSCHSSILEDEKLPDVGKDENKFSPKNCEEANKEPDYSFKKAIFKKRKSAKLPAVNKRRKSDCSNEDESSNVMPSVETKIGEAPTIIKLINASKMSSGQDEVESISIFPIETENVEVPAVVEMVDKIKNTSSSNEITNIVPSPVEINKSEAPTAIKIENESKKSSSNKIQPHSIPPSDEMNNGDSTMDVGPSDDECLSVDVKNLHVATEILSEEVTGEEKVINESVGHQISENQPNVSNHCINSSSQNKSPSKFSETPKKVVDCQLIDKDSDEMNNEDSTMDVDPSVKFDNECLSVDVKNLQVATENLSEEDTGEEEVMNESVGHQNSENQPNVSNHCINSSSQNKSPSKSSETSKKAVDCQLIDKDINENKITISTVEKSAVINENDPDSSNTNENMPSVGVVETIELASKNCVQNSKTVSFMSDSFGSDAKQRLNSSKLNLSEVALESEGKKESGLKKDTVLYLPPEKDVSEINVAINPSDECVSVANKSDSTLSSTNEPVKNLSPELNGDAKNETLEDNISSLSNVNNCAKDDALINSSVKMVNSQVQALETSERRSSYQSNISDDELTLVIVEDVEEKNNSNPEDWEDIKESCLISKEKPTDSKPSKKAQKRKMKKNVKSCAPNKRKRPQCSSNEVETSKVALSITTVLKQIEKTKIEEELSNSPHFKLHVHTLVNALVNPSNASDTSSALYQIFSHMSSSRLNPLLAFAIQQDKSVFLPLLERCIVAALIQVEHKKKNHLKNLISTAIASLYCLVLEKKSISKTGLGAFCRIFTELCKSVKNKTKPMKLCCDLIKARHPLAPYLIASIVGVWSELFVITGETPELEELLRNCIAYSISKKPQTMNSTDWKHCKILFSEYLMVPPTFNVTQIAENVLNDLKLMLDESPFENDLTVIEPLIIFSAFENWSWTKETILKSFIMPLLAKYAQQEENESAFTILCELLAEVGLSSPEFQEPCSIIWGFFMLSEDEAHNYVKDCAARSLVKMLLTKKIEIPEALYKWVQENQDKLVGTPTEILLKRRIIADDMTFKETDIISES